MSAPCWPPPDDGLRLAGIMLTTLLSYLSHSQVWATQQGSTVHVAGRSNKAKVEFSGELEDMLLALPQTPAAAGGSSSDG